MFAGTVTRQSAKEMLVEALVNRIRLSGGMVWTGWAAGFARCPRPPAGERPRGAGQAGPGCPWLVAGPVSRGIAVRPGEVVAASE